ncbi:MAG TPA: tRNA (guanine(46)-N(7))-methyltransferase TrmB, partial [Rhizomicrobium sp.]
MRGTLLPALVFKPEPGLDPRRYFSPPQHGEVETSEARIGWGLPPAAAIPPPEALRASTSPCWGGEVTDVWLEVGYGAGEHLLWQARAHPRIGLIGAEPYISGTAKLLSKLEADPVPNIRLYEDDARDIIAALPAASIDRFFLLFPDPWPKTRHHKRRFLQMAMLDDLARILKPGAELRFASDDAGYLAHA